MHPATAENDQSVATICMSVSVRLHYDVTYRRYTLLVVLLAAAL